MLDKKQTAEKWLDKVFLGLEDLERDITTKLDNGTITTNLLENQINKLQNHYAAISNLSKSFQDNSFFVGYID